MNVVVVFFVTVVLTYDSRSLDTVFLTYDSRSLDTVFLTYDSRSLEPFWLEAEQLADKNSCFFFFDKGLNSCSYYLIKRRKS